MTVFCPSAPSSSRQGDATRRLPAKILPRPDLPQTPLRDLHSLCELIDAGAGLAIIADEALQTADLRPLADFCRISRLGRIFQL